MKEIDEDNLGEAFRAVPDGGCSDQGEIDSGKIWDLVEGRLKEQEVLDYADAAAEDPELAEAWHLALEIKRERERRRKVTPFRRLVSSRSFMALAAVLLVGISLPLLFHKTSHQPLLRGSYSDEILNLLGETRALPRENFVLRWRDTSDHAVSCDLLLMGQDLQEVFSAEKLQSGKFRVDPEELMDLDGGETILWQLKCHRRNGEIQASKTWSIAIEE